MITLNMHEAKTRLSELVAMAEKGEDVVICRNGHPSVRLTPVESTAIRRDRIAPDSALRVIFAPGFDPTEPLSEDEWPSDLQ